MSTHKIVHEPIEESGASYACEKLSVAVWKLATGVDGIKARLADVYIELAILQESDFPSDLVGEWKQLKTDLISGKMQYDTKVVDSELVEVAVGRLHSTLRYMRKKKAQDIAKRICLLSAKLESRVKET